MQHSQIDIWHMKSALNLARTGLGRTYPNPSVGCVIVDNADYILARACTADMGRPHAETSAIELAGESVKGATVYVTLEPCAHVGATGSCADALVKAQVKRVVIAIQDPDPRVAGAGVKMLEDAGVDVTIGVLADEAYKLNEGYFLSREQGRPLVTLKTATTLDNKIATASGESQWITGACARMRGHLERNQHDAIMVGVGTALADKPNLRGRINGVHYQGIRILCDTSLKIHDSDWFFDNIDQSPVWIFCGLVKNDAKVKALEAKGAKVIRLSRDENGQVDIAKALSYMAIEGITRVLVEGGSTLIGSFIKHNLYDRMLHFSNPSIIGADGLNAFPALAIDKLDARVKLHKTETIELGEDRLDVYRNYHR